MATVEKKFQLQVQSSTENLALIREFVAGIGIRAGLDSSAVHKLQLAVDEACANIIEHAHGHDATKEVVLRATFDARTLEIQLEDSGPAFDPSDVLQPELEQLVAGRRRGGLGLRLMKNLMDEVRYERLPDQKNRLSMIKRLDRPFPPAEQP